MSVSLIGRRPAVSSSISFCLFILVLFFYQNMLGIMSSSCFLFFLFTSSPPSVSCFLFLVHRISSMTHPLPPNTEDPHHQLSIEQAPNSRRNPTEPILTSENAQWRLFCYVREANYACPPMYHFTSHQHQTINVLATPKMFQLQVGNLETIQYFLRWIVLSPQCRGSRAIYIGTLALARM